MALISGDDRFLSCLQSRFPASSPAPSSLCKILPERSHSSVSDISRGTLLPLSFEAAVKGGSALRVLQPLACLSVVQCSLLVLEVPPRTAAFRLNIPASPDLPDLVPHMEVVLPLILVQFLLVKTAFILSFPTPKEKALQGKTRQVRNGKAIWKDK